MRFINALTLKLEPFRTHSKPCDYAILSHRWIYNDEVCEEVTFQDFQDLQDTKEYTILSDRWKTGEKLSLRHFRDVIQREVKNGFAKILATCEQARTDGIKYVWVDTCCIDKSSSSELSEAINSMFKWYRDSKICYAYLQDIAILDGDGEPKLEKSEWMERGWTLQELIAPREMAFYCQDEPESHWRFLGNKHDLAQQISRITGIDADLLRGRMPLELFSVARRMSWAATRRTTREEDTAYSLLGIFDVNMPLLYGEGSKAFIRLQEEIFKKIDDQTIFAWQEQQPTVWHSSRGMFASSPRAFLMSKDLIPLRHFTIGNLINVTSRGLQANTTVCPTSEMLKREGIQDSFSHLLLPLDCPSLQSPDREDMFTAILLVWAKGNRYVRAQPDRLFEVRGDQISRDTTVFIERDFTTLFLESPDLLRSAPCTISIQLPDQGISLLDTSPVSGSYDQLRSAFFVKDPSKALRAGRECEFGLAFEVQDHFPALIAIKLSLEKGRRVLFAAKAVSLEGRLAGRSLGGTCLDLLHPESPTDSPIITQDIRLSKRPQEGITRPFWRDNSSLDTLRVSLQPLDLELGGLLFVLRLCTISSRPHLRSFSINI